MRTPRYAPLTLFVCLCLVACGGSTATDAKSLAGGSAQTDTSTAILVTGTTPAAAEGKQVHARLLASDGSTLAAASGAVTAQAFSLTLDANGAAAAEVAAFIDINGDAVCNIAPTDVGGSATLGSSGNVQLNLTSATQAPCSAFGDFALTVGGNDFTPHNNQMIYAALRDTGSNAYVTLPKGVKVLSGVWQLSFAGALVHGRSYELDYFADIAGDKQCQNHSWAKTIPTATASVTLMVSHDDTMSAICSNFPSMTTLAN